MMDQRESRREIPAIRLPGEHNEVKPARKNCGVLWLLNLMKTRRCARVTKNETFCGTCAGDSRRSGNPRLIDDPFSCHADDGGSLSVMVEAEPNMMQRLYQLKRRRRKKPTSTSR